MLENHATSMLKVSVRALARRDCTDGGQLDRRVGTRTHRWRWCGRTLRMRGRVHLTLEEKAAVNDLRAAMVCRWAGGEARWRSAS